MLSCQSPIAGRAHRKALATLCSKPLDSHHQTHTVLVLSSHTSPYNHLHPILEPTCIPLHPHNPPGDKPHRVWVQTLLASHTNLILCTFPACRGGAQDSLLVCCILCHKLQVADYCPEYRSVHLHSVQ